MTADEPVTRPVTIQSLASVGTVADIFSTMEYVGLSGLTLAVDPSRAVRVDSSDDYDGLSLRYVRLPMAHVLASHGAIMFADLLDEDVWPFGFELVIPKVIKISSETPRTLTFALGHFSTHVALTVVLHLCPGSESSVDRLRDVFKRQWDSMFVRELEVCGFTLAGRHDIWLVEPFP
jgi:hypothetical protein